jgi:hypothetical protein
MAVMTPEAQTDRATPRRRPGLTLLVAVLSTVPYGVGVLLPYYANGLHHRPAGETLYAHDMSTLWPYDTALGGVVAFVAVVGIPMFPFVTVAVAAWSGFNLWDARRELTWTAIALYVAAAAVAVASLGWLTTPLASELFVWLVD